MPFPLSLNQADYEALVEFARQGTLDVSGYPVTEKARALDSFLRELESRNGIERYAVWVQWQEQDAPLPPGTTFPDKWPPELRFYLALTTRPIARADVDQLLRVKARSPISVLVTHDPGGQIGWTEIDVFFK